MLSNEHVINTSQQYVIKGLISGVGGYSRVPTISNVFKLFSTLCLSFEILHITIFATKTHVTQNGQVGCLNNYERLLNLIAWTHSVRRSKNIGELMNLKPTYVLTFVRWRFKHSRGTCQVIYSQFGLAIHQNDHQARRRFVEWAQNEIAVVPDFHKRILFSDEAHFWLNGYVNKQNCRIWSEANPQVYVETPLHPEKLTVWCALWAGGILLQKR
ncbi:hypothetical protein TNCV_3258971 [Trichonephila clavipes]|nr:hypothetical protein TNCV_3258971 [Trichonephila clavipes]